MHLLASGRVEAASQEDRMIDIKQIKPKAEIIGADGVHVGTVDVVHGHRIKLIKKDSGEGVHAGHHHFIPLALVAEIEDGTIRLSANADVAVTFEEEADGVPTELRTG
jgi:hypothetical protein